MKQLELPPSVKRKAWKNGLTSYVLETTHGRAEITNLGAHVVSWKPTGHDDIFWISPTTQAEVGQPIRGGIPICAPWFGKGPSGSREPMHGPVRINEWALMNACEPEPGFTEVSFLFQTSSQQYGPKHQPFSIIYSVAIGPNKMVIQSDVWNTGSGPLAFELMMHTYFAVCDTSYASVTGLENREWVDKSDMSVSVNPILQTDMITFDALETSMMFSGNPPKCFLNDLVGGRQIGVETLGANNLLVWNPGAEKAKTLPGFDPAKWKETVCLETGNAGENLIQLPVNHHHKTKTVYNVQSL